MLKKAAEMQKKLCGRKESTETDEQTDRQRDLSSKKSQLDHARKSVTPGLRVLLKNEMPVNQKVKL